MLIGHSYGGMVATGVADRVPDRISQLIYLDAFVPQDGQSLLDLQGPDAARGMRERVKAGDGWRVEPNPPPPDTPPDDLKWIQAHRMAQPLKCFDTPVRLKNGDLKLPRAYIYCSAPAGGRSVPRLRRAGETRALGLQRDRREPLSPRDRA